MAYLGEEIKKLGFGLMRLPQRDGAIDVEQTKQMVDLFMEAGFTYFDTAWAYAGSEDAIRQALADTSDFVGVTGEITFDENGDAQKSVAIVKTVEGGEFKYLDTVTITN